MPRWAVWLRNRIPAAFMPRIAAQDSPRRECATAHCAMSPQCVNRVIATMWPEPAIGANQGPYRPLIGADGADRRLSRQTGSLGHVTKPRASAPAMRSARRMSSRRTGKARARVPSRPISTRSTPTRLTPGSGKAASSRRAASFKRRLVRLRTTALPIFLVTVTPILAGAWSFRVRICSTNPWVAALRPFAATSRKSERRFRRPKEAGGRNWDTRWVRPVPKQASGRRSSGGQPFAALGAAVRQHPAAADRGHAGAKPVAALADKLRRLIGALHDFSPDLSIPRERGRGVLRGAGRNKRRLIRARPDPVNALMPAPGPR